MRASKKSRIAGAAIVVAAFSGLLTTFVRAQEFWPPWGRFLAGPRLATPGSFDGSFQVCRGMYQRHPRGTGGGWSTDYPSADVNLSVRFSELTKAPVSRDSSGGPNHLVVRLTDPELFRCPFLLMSEVGAAYFDEEDAASLREYFMKGGMIGFMTHNTDISDSWEREGEDPGYFYQFSVNGYALAVNVLLYAMTH